MSAPDNQAILDAPDVRAASMGPQGRSPIYLDNHALTPVDARVAKAVHDEMTRFQGNANSSDHIHGEWAARRLQMSAVAVGRLLRVYSDDVRFTSSATEALRLALAHAVGGARRGPLRVALSAIEHPALIDMVRDAERAGVVAPTWLPCDEQARIPLEAIEAAAEAGADLVCVIAANNEVGTVQAIGEIAALLADHPARLLLDASQAAGRLSLDNRQLDAEYIVLSGHKMYGPSGVGALVGPSMFDARFSWPAGGHEPTPNIAGAVGLAEACTLRLAEMADDEARIAKLRDRLQVSLLEAVPDLVVNGNQTSRLAGNLHLSAKDAPNDQVVARLRGTVSISTGAACASGADAPSHVLRAMGVPAWRQDGALRIGVGKFNTLEDIDMASAAIAQAICDVRRS